MYKLWYWLQTTLHFGNSNCVSKYTLNLLHTVQHGVEVSAIVSICLTHGYMNLTSVETVEQIKREWHDYSLTIERVVRNCIVNWKSLRAERRVIFFQISCAVGHLSC